MKKTLKKYPAGGIVMFAKNIETREQTKKMIKKGNTFFREKPFS